jgi:beta-glucanase (GH16 family)
MDIDSINNFETGIKEYTQDRIIYYLDIQILNNLGII